jgi:RNA polymerase sigma-70 factor (ECF subfamily)
MTEGPGDSTSTDLLRRAQAGDRHALGSLIQLYMPRLRAWARGRLPSGAREIIDTQDLVQETMIAAVRNLQRIEIRGEGALQAYLRTILANRITDHHRRAVRRPGIEELASDLPANGASPLEEAIGAEALDRYERALERLGEDDRHAIILRIELCRDYDEIASALDKSSASSARMAVSRALSRLAREMRDARS